MLLTPKTIDEVILMDLRGHCAEDPITGAYLSRSTGRRRSGRKSRFYFKAPGMEIAKVIFANTTSEAVEIANSFPLVVPADALPPSA
jgi:hypothetical protein